MNQKYLWKISKLFAPDFPRNASSAVTIQSERSNRSALVSGLEEAAAAGMPGYYSVYSFPRGHPQEGNIPKIDCIFIDLDVTNEHYDPKTGDTSFEGWRRDMSALLARARMIADAILDGNNEDHFRVALSGHKGLHLYLDFPAIDPSNGDIAQFKAGLSEYGNDVIDWLDRLAGGVNIKPWVDVDGSDLARLARHPNTPHHGVEHVDGTKWCVPVTVGEMATLHVDDYLELTDGPRFVVGGLHRTPSEYAHDRAVQAVRTAAPSSGSTAGSSRRSKSKRSALEEYREEIQNDDIESVDDVLFLMSNRPCFEAFRERDDAYEHGDASRTMELSIMGRLLSMDVPIEVIHKFFQPIPGYDEETTNDMLADLLARGNEYGEFQCATICGGINNEGGHVPGKASQFCLGSDCAIHRRAPGLDDP